MGTVMNESRRQILLDTPHTETATGAIATFETDMVGRAKEVKVEIEPVQDLHGYDNPWPAGGGKNKIIPIDRSFVNNGVPVVCSSSDETVTIKGTAISSGGRTTKMTNDVLLPAGPYILSVTAISGTKQATYIVNKTSDNSYVSGGSFTLTEDTQIYVGANVLSGTTYDEVVHLQIERGSPSTAWTPYSNICPISGWTGANVEARGKNFAEIRPFSEWVRKYAYSTLDTKLPPNTRAYMTLTDKDTSVDVSGVSLGFIDSSYTGTTPLNNNQFRWVMQNGRVNSNRSNIPNDNDSSVYLNGLFIYSNTEDAYNKLFSRYNIMVELSPTATSYEPFHGSTTPISWADEAGTVYGGTLEWEKDGSVTLTKTHESVNLSSLTWQRRSTNPYRFSASLPSGKYYTNAVDVSQHKCSIFPTAYTTSMNNTKEGYLGIYRIPTQTGADNTIYLRFADTVTTLTELNAFLAETNPQYCYPLADPVTYTLTPQEALVFLRGTNNVWNDINDTSVIYWTHKTGDSV